MKVWSVFWCQSVAVWLITALP